MKNFFTNWISNNQIDSMHELYEMYSYLKIHPNSKEYKRLMKDNRLEHYFNFTYEKNSLNFRSEEFDTPSDYKILWVGDSFCYGEYLPIDCIYTVKTVKKLSEEFPIDLKHYNMAWPGASIQKIFRNVDALLKKNNFDMLVLMAPSWLRGEFFYHVSFEQFETLYKDPNSPFPFPFYMRVEQDKNFRFSESLKSKTKNLDEVQELYSWLNYIRLIKYICKEKQIKFLWTSWAILYGLDNLLVPDDLKEEFIFTEDISYDPRAPDNLHPGSNYHTEVSNRFVDRIRLILAEKYGK